MPSYNDLRPQQDSHRTDYAQAFPDMLPDEKKRTLASLLRLRAGLDEKIVPKQSDRNLLIASWNIKEFGHTGQRLSETYFYIAEIISRFDLVVIQEIKRGLRDLHLLMKLLGDDWAYLVNDITEGTDGNRERSAYLYNKKRVEFAGLAGEIVLWDELTQGSTLKQLKRTPYMTGFRAGWKLFAMLNVHLHPGAGDANVTYRRKEMDMLLAALQAKKQAGHLWTDKLVIAGDFNFYNGANRDDATVQAIHGAGYREVESLVGVDTNASLTETYDRLFIRQGDYFTVARDGNGDEVGGVFNPFDYVIRFGDEAVYLDAMKAVYGGDSDLDQPAARDYYFKNYWRKNQLSDHFPIWFELITDSSDEFLAEKLAEYP